MPMNVQQLMELGKRHGQEVVLVLVIALVGVGGYLIGKTESFPETEARISAEWVDSLAVAGEADKDMRVVASSKGSKYYFLGCSGAKAIREQNRVTFTSPEEAEAKGYTQAAGCEP